MIKKGFQAHFRLLTDFSISIDYLDHGKRLVSIFNWGWVHKGVGGSWESMSNFLNLFKMMELTGACDFVNLPSILYF